MRPDRHALVVWCVALVGLAAPAAGQVVLRFHPRAGSLMRTQSDIDVTTTYVGLAAVPDSETAQLTMRVNVSRRPAAPLNGRWVVQLTLDSARATSRFGNGGRKDVSLPFDGTAVAVTVDSVMAPGGADPPLPSPPADTARRGFTRALAPAFMLPLATKPVSPGATWAADLSVPLSDLMPPGIPGALAGPRQLVAHGTAKLDSLVPRGADTLAYVSYTGTFEPVITTSRDTTGTTTTTVRGGLAASQIWSTSWSGWVSGGLHSRVELKLHAGTTDATTSADVTARMQVRP
ncbi:MAG TPA: hypothetical protein VGI83_01500 [Gemmatimonadales bacterium]|jgi:hypothetical protein